jgi:ribosomal protein S6E (S10)
MFCLTFSSRLSVYNYFMTSRYNAAAETWIGCIILGGTQEICGERPSEHPSLGLWVSEGEDKSGIAMEGEREGPKRVRAHLVSMLMSSLLYLHE